MIDWSMIVLRIQNKGICAERLAKMINGCPVHLRRLARCEVNQPKFNIGIKLLDLHSDICPDDHKDLRI